MLFNTIDFAVFFILFYILYCLLRKQLTYQNVLILAGSYIFYGWWDVRFLFLIVISTVVDYSVGLIIDKGFLTVEQRIKASLYIITSALFFLVFQYGEVAESSDVLMVFNISSIAITISLFGLKVFLATLLLVSIFNLIYPMMPSVNGDSGRKKYLVVSIVSNLSILGFFKYFNFFADSLVVASEAVFGISPGWFTLNVILPVGISFYTFQTMSYTIDVYRRELKASENLLEFGAFVAFFPQLVAGPIERGKHLLPQFQSIRPKVSSEQWREGIWLIFWGLFKKMVVADNLAVIVNSVFEPYDSLAAGGAIPADGLMVVAAIYAFALQIYCDFSGYTDIARGTAKLLGFDLMVNFKLPYFATSPSSFWRQWHISLSTWLRDYLYIPLGGNKNGSLMTYRNLSLTMLLGGLWHGASWTFVLWGAYQGFLLSIYRVLGIGVRTDGYRWWKLGLMGLVMFHLTCLGWLIFRAQNITTITAFLQAILTSPYGSDDSWSALVDILYFSWFLLGFQIVQAITKNSFPLQNFHWMIRLTVWSYVIMSLLVLSSSTKQEFIYFAF